MISKYYSARIKFLLLTVALIITVRVSPQHTDPYHSETGGFGYKLYSGGSLTAWWCEGAYKIMHDTRVPENQGDTIRIWSAGNEYESFQVVITSDRRADRVRTGINSLTGSDGKIWPGSIESRRVEYVYISKPTDSYGYAGWWPDPLPELDGSFIVQVGENSTVWFTLFTPPDTRAGVYTGSVEISINGELISLPVKLTVWDFTLPHSPSVRSGIGLSVDKIAAYHNLSTETQLEHTFDLYMEAFRKYRISPYYFQALSPVKDTIEGVYWRGGLFDGENSRSGQFSLKVVDDDPSISVFSEYRLPVKVTSSSEYLLEWDAMTGEEDQQFCILAEGYNAEGEYLVFENRMELFKGAVKWKRYSYNIGIPGYEVAFLRIKLFPVLRTEQGEYTGEAWFDNVSVKGEKSGDNLITQGDFEVDPDSVKIKLDFSRFDIAAERYLDDFGFNSFRIDLRGMGSGTYFSRKEGEIAGFGQGTGQYRLLMDSYLDQIEDHLAAKGWLEKAFVYWFDEPSRQDYPFVRDGMETIKRGAPGLPTLLTENDPGPEIMDVTDISCTIWHRIDPGKARKVTEQGNEYWSYLCTAPKYPWLSEFIDHDAINLRMWLWGTWSYGLNGILLWSSNYWTSRSASPAGYLQNPWTEPASFVQGYGWPFGKQTQWGNGDGRFFYPPNMDPNNDHSTYIEGPVPSIRLEFLRDGIEDYEYLTLLRRQIDETSDPGNPVIISAKQLLDIPGSIFKDGKTYTRNPQLLLQYRMKLAEMILLMMNDKEN